MEEEEKQFEMEDIPDEEEEGKVLRADALGSPDKGKHLAKY